MTDQPIFLNPKDGEAVIAALSSVINTLQKQVRDVQSRAEGNDYSLAKGADDAYLTVEYVLDMIVHGEWPRQEEAS